MGMRPPSGGGDDEPASIEFGIAAVDAELKRSELAFPASHAEVEATLGDAEIPYDVHGNAVSLREVLAELETREFDDRQELLNALHPVFETYRERRSGSMFAQIRALLPF